MWLSKSGLRDIFHRIIRLADDTIYRMYHKDNPSTVNTYLGTEVGM